MGARTPLGEAKRVPAVRFGTRQLLARVDCHARSLSAHGDASDAAAVRKPAAWTRLSALVHNPLHQDLIRLRLLVETLMRLGDGGLVVVRPLD